MKDLVGQLDRRGLLLGLAGAGALGALAAVGRAFAADKLVVGVIYVGPRDDYGYNQAQAQAAAALKKMPGLTVVEQEKVPETTDVQKTMGSMIEQDGATLLFPTSFGYFDPHILRMAEKYPKVRFAHCGGLWTEGKHPKNAGSYFGYIDECQYLNGVVAGHTTKTKKLGFIAAKPIPQVLRNINAFTMGARSIDPKITTQLIVTGDWALPVKEAEAANSLIDQGVDVVTCHVDSPKVVVETAERRSIFVCGYHADQSTLAPKGYLTGAEWSWTTPYTTHVKDAMAGKPMNNFMRGGLKDGFVKAGAYGGLRALHGRARAEPARDLRADLPGGVRQCLLLAEHARARGPARADGALRRAAGTGGLDGDRRRGRGGARRPRRRNRRPPPERRRADRREGGDGAGRHGGRRHLDRAGRRAPAVSRGQRDDLEPPADLRRRRALQSFRRGAAARSDEPQQALDRPDRRREHDRQPARPRHPLGARLRPRVLRGDARARALHDVRVRAAHRRRQPARGAPGWSTGRAARADRVRARRRRRRPRRRRGSRRGPRQRQRVADRGLRLRRHRRRVHRPPKSARDRAGGGAGGRSLRVGRDAAAAARPARCARARLAGHRVHAAPRGRMQPAARQRHRRRDRPHAVRHRARVLPWQAVRAAQGAHLAGDSARGVERLAADSRGAPGEPALPDRPGAGHRPRLGVSQHALGTRGPHGGRQLRRRAGHGLRGAARAHALDRARRMSRRHRRLVLITVLSGELERGAVERSGTDGGGARDLRALEPDPVLLRRAALRRRGRAGSGAAVGRRHVRLLSLQRRAVRGHARHHDRDVLAAAHAFRRSWRAQHQPMSMRRQSVLFTSDVGARRAGGARGGGGCRGPVHTLHKSSARRGGREEGGPLAPARVGEPRRPPLR